MNRLQRQPHVGAEFLYRDELMVGLIKNDFDFLNEITAVPFTFASDALNVFWVNAKARDFGSHESLFLLNQSCGDCLANHPYVFGRRKRKLLTRDRSPSVSGLVF